MLFVSLNRSPAALAGAVPHVWGRGNIACPHRIANDRDPRDMRPLRRVAAGHIHRRLQGNWFPDAKDFRRRFKEAFSLVVMRIRVGR